MKKTFVTGADSRYYPLLLEWLHSFKRFPGSDEFDICVIDSGLKLNQSAHLKNMVTHIVKPEWPDATPLHKVKNKEFLRSCLCRPYINQIFPDYDLYFWMDADTWVQTWEGVALFVEGAMNNKIALTSSVDRAYPKGMRVKFQFPFPPKPRSFYYSNVKKVYGRAMAEKLFPMHQLLAGAFCLRATAPHWSRWQAIISDILEHPRSNAFTAEQLALGILIHIEGYEADILPAWTHWLCEHKPLWDQDLQTFVEPFTPNETLGILHLSGVDEMRANRSVKDSFQTLNGQDIELSYRYPYFNGEKVS